mgnify:CR=1 FL=1
MVSLPLEHSPPYMYYSLVMPARRGRGSPPHAGRRRAELRGRELRGREEIARYWASDEWRRGLDGAALGGAGLLLGAGCDPAAKDKYGITALDFAKRNNARSVDLKAVFEQSIAARVNRILSDYQSALQTGLALQALGNANMAVDVYERALYTSQHAGERSRLHYMIGKARTAPSRHNASAPCRD